MQISVIIPVYNAAPFVRKAVESALQLGETGEVILVEDGSTDGSLAICEQLVFEYQKVKLFKHAGGGNRGAGASRNLGIRKASYDFIALLDADDYFLPGRFDKDKEILLNHPEIDGVHNALGCHYYTDDPEILENFKNRDFTAIKEKVHATDLFYQMAPVGKNGYFHLNTLTIRKRALNKVGNFNIALKLSQDTQFMVRLVAVCQIACGEIDKPVAMRGVHSTNRSFHKNVKVYRLMMFESLFEWGVSNSLPLDKLSLLWRVYFKEYRMSIRNGNLFVSKLKEIIFQIKGCIANPSLLMSKAYWSCYPGFNLILSENYVRNQLTAIGYKDPMPSTDH